MAGTEGTTTPKYRVENTQPVLNVVSIEASIGFYVGLLGFRNAEWGTDEFTSVHRDGGGGIYLCRGGQGSGQTWVWVGIDGNLDEIHDFCLSKGARIVMPPTNFSWAYEMHIADPDGHVLRLGTEPRDDKPFVDRD